MLGLSDKFLDYSADVGQFNWLLLYSPSKGQLIVISAHTQLSKNILTGLLE